ncbi:hypothetical protein BGZ65_000373, partial [Modicella reniformis]
MATALVTKNDYFEGIKYLGIKRNLDIVRTIDLEPGPCVQSITNAVNSYNSYLDRVNDLGNKAISDYHYAITAFAECREDEDPSGSATPSATTHHE